ncbi:uncharacterized protein LOC122571469 [Bombus pyrosoma]|uniref:uncharacterized protein LOC122571469 n=1 Tax=Bombus pyrosoma TaxID=396416 RepID=UPI001CB93DA0|nr:uncharacterized protein LOC122571469 [Bombus pyrosoma]
MSYSDYVETAWTPDIIGPIYKKESTNLREVLNAHRDDNCTRIMATFVPDELIYESDLSKKNFRKFTAVMAMISLTQFVSLYRKYISGENGGSYALFSLLNRYIEIIIEEVYLTHGDVLKFSRTSIDFHWY